MQKMCEALMGCIIDESTVGVGTGRTVEKCIDMWSADPSFLDKSYVVSSIRTKDYLENLGYQVLWPNDVMHVKVYFDGADQIDRYGCALKGLGGAMMQEKLLMKMAETCIAVAGEEKYSDVLQNNDIPLPVEVVKQARSYVARVIKQRYNDTIIDWREGVLTDHGHPILDVRLLPMSDLEGLERWLKSICGVVESGLCAERKFDKLLLARGDNFEIKHLA